MILDMFKCLKSNNFKVNYYVRLIAKNSKSKYGRYLKRKLEMKNSILLSLELEHPIHFPHPQNIVIGAGTQIGKNCVVYHNVTIGQNGGCYPQIGNGVIIFPGSIIVGDIVIGDGAVIGANSVVTKDVENNAVVAGNPAHFIRMREENEKFY